ncbi:hypothetical protein [Dyella halodurans]|uniref:Uncharacterized protein n=1 Tax=Dyella halodurans TaxID=1920171 RepID=A0ABV9C1C3_9GAMM|nr:hypothetical protein [Dyella halodurans]
MSKTILGRVCAGLLVLGLSSSAFADPPSTGLGQAWPNATDVSSSPNFHAYVFVLGGVKYVQINDLNGNVLAAIGMANGQFLTLPIGRFAQFVRTPQQPAAVATTATPVSSPTTVYQDATTQVTTTPQSDGTMQVSALATCSDPIVCNTHIQ